ncbi:MAG: family 43 glycosylhydrolase [Bacteroidales bacterium]|nr:family 43 glycosylhydrolase [Bacteroidales bacterium]
MKRILKLFIFLLLTGWFTGAFADYPLVSHRFLADPGSLVYNGRVYLYCSNDDENPPTEDGGYQMKSIVCVSSSDMKNWTDHGIVFQVPRDASWAGNSWAPSAVERNGKIYLYFGNGGSGIGVASADSPTGPFSDPVSRSLVNINTPGVLPAENIWVFDPMTFIDDDGQAYMYFGGNGEDNLRVIRLNENMISVDGSATQFHVPYFFEAAWLHKHNGTYYFSYSTNPSNGMRIDYMTSDNPITGFTYGGTVSPQPPENNNNNHQAIFEFKGTWYQAYHNRYVARHAGIPPVYKRNLCLDSIHHNPDDSVKTMVNTFDGVVQVGHVNPFVRVEAETMNAQKGICTKVCSEGGMNVTGIENNDWIKVRGVDFGSNGAAAFTAGIASEMKYGTRKDDSIEIRMDNVNGTVIGTLPVTFTGGPDDWKPVTVAVEEITGVHDLFFVFTGEAVEDLFNFDYWYFTEKTAAHDLLAINASTDDYKIDTIAGYDSTIIRVTAIYTDGTSADITSEVIYTYDQENIVTIADSVVRGTGYGTVTITAGYNDMTDSVKVIVKDLEGELTLSRLYADNSDIDLLIGGSISLKITAEFKDGHVEDVTGKVNYENPHPEIATIANGVITALSEGEVDITVSYRGETGDVTSITIHVTVSGDSGVWLEAECGTTGSLWDIVTDSNASHNEYVTIRPGNNSLDTAPADTSGLLSFTFDITAGGTYTIFVRVICPTANDDSFWFRMDDGTYYLWNNIPGSSAWKWTDFPSTYNLSAGSHTLTIGYREDGARLDKLWITNAGNAPVDEGAEAGNCSPVTHTRESVHPIGLYPNPVSDELNIALPFSPSEINIYSSDGREIFTQHTRTMKTTISLVNYDPGLYLIKMTGQGQIVVKRVIKN